MDDELDKIDRYQTALKTAYQVMFWHKTDPLPMIRTLAGAMYFQTEFQKKALSRVLEELVILKNQVSSLRK